MTSAGEIFELVETSALGDWVPFSNLGTWTYQNDVSLRIERHEQLDSRFNAPWTQAMQGTCETYSYIVYYDSSPVEYNVIVSVDDFRAHIPMPQDPVGPNQPFTISPYQETLGEIITGDAQTFSAYLNRTNIQVQR